MFSDVLALTCPCWIFLGFLALLKMSRFEIQIDYLYCLKNELIAFKPIATQPPGPLCSTAQRRL